MRQQVALALLAALASRPAHAQASLREYRPELIVTLPRWHGVGVTLLEEQHLATRALARTEELRGLGLVSPAFTHGSVGVEMRQVRLGSGAFEHRWIPTVTLRTELGLLELRDRARVELRDLDGAWSRRYQNRLTLTHHMATHRLVLDPYLYHDLSWDSRVRVLNRREAGIGVRVPLARGTSVDPFVMRQTDTRRTPEALVALGLIVRVAL